MFQIQNDILISYKETPDSQSVDGGEFESHRSSTSITIPEGVTSIGDGAFIGCSSLTSITIPEGVTSIGDTAFADCSSLTSITIPRSVTSIGCAAFADCSSLTSITIPEGVTSIGREAFADCSSLTLITIPEGVTSIGDWAFYGCSDLTSITIPESVSTIGDWIFKDCSSLTSITIPEGVTSIGHGAFSGCNNLNSLTIPSSVREVGFAAFSGCNTELLKYVCRFPVVFNRIEPNTQEYGRVVSDFITEKLAQLHTAQATNPEVVLEIREPDEAKLCFYMIRNLIRQNNGALRDELLFLMNIPQVKALLHTAVNEGQSNELLQLALSIGNQEAASLLLNVPAVLALAQENGMYAGIAKGGLNLRQLARNRESAMTALSVGESKRLEKAIAHYTPAIEDLGGSAVVIERLLEHLKARYKDHPAMLVRDDQSELELPLDWLGEEGFAALLPTLTATEQQRAKQAYHVHPDHTALRYLSKPNYWMDAQASYVYVNDAHTERWSTFEEYNPLIALMYLAAIDEEIPALNGYTIETRFEHFINELCHINRAHNWDERNQAGAEYDNTNQGDKPSCYSGVKRRLFQSVLGHPLFQLLTLDIINQELDGFVRAFFEQRIDETNANALQEACNQLFIDGALEEKNGELLATLNIPEKDQEQFIASLQTKYGEALEPAFLIQLHTRLQLDEETPFHAVRFAIPVSLMELLEKKIAAIPSAQASASSAAFFKAPSSEESSPDSGQSPESGHGLT